MKKIALTGNIGVGKTTVAKVFELLNVKVYYADIEAKKHFYKSEVKSKLKHMFGNCIFDNSQNIIFKELASIVFKNKKALGNLNSIIHPMVLHDFDMYIASLKTDKNYILFESAVIYENSLSHLFDAVILVTSSKELSVKRVLKRDGVSEDVITERLNNQIAESDLLGMTDFIIQNNDKNLIIPQILYYDNFFNKKPV